MGNISNGIITGTKVYSNSINFYILLESVRIQERHNNIPEMQVRFNLYMSYMFCVLEDELYA